VPGHKNVSLPPLPPLLYSLTGASRLATLILTTVPIDHIAIDHVAIDHIDIDHRLD